MARRPAPAAGAPCGLTPAGVPGICVVVIDLSDIVSRQDRLAAQDRRCSTNPGATHPRPRRRAWKVAQTGYGCRAAGSAGAGSKPGHVPPSTSSRAASFSSRATTAAAAPNRGGGSW